LRRRLPGQAPDQPAVSSRQHAAALRLLEGGKRVGRSAYLHVSLLALQARPVRELVRVATALAGPASIGFTVVRLRFHRPEVALLDYPRFFEEAFPALWKSWLVDLCAKTAKEIDFSARENPPILHRKELLLPEGHPDRVRFARFTAALEEYGAFAQPPHLIGQRSYWDRSLAALGLSVDGHEVRMVRQGTEQSSAKVTVERHRTAIARSGLSAPMQALARWGFLDGAPTVLDYGCGRGDDVRALSAAGLPAVGWDPHFVPDAPRATSDVVNLGFVLNVIDDPAERSATLRAAFGLATRVLSVAVMTIRKDSGCGHADGHLTTRGTFQKYFSQAELRAYVAEVLGREAVTVGPGLVFVFRSDEEEQAFLARRQRRAVNAIDGSVGMPLPPAKARAAGRTSAYARHQDLLDAFWSATLDLGRLPEADEFGRWDELSAALGSPRRALAALPHPGKQLELAEAAERRSEDMLVYLALNLFDRRASLRSLPPAVQRDIRAFFGSHKAALERAQAALLAAGDQALTVAASASGAARGDGILDEDDGDYTFHVALSEAQPVPLRILIGCAERLEPLPADADLVKVHGSGDRVSYLAFDGFQDRALPTLARRTVVDLRRRRVSEVPVDTADGRRVLLGKASVMPAGMAGRDRQERFDNGLRARGVFARPGLGPGLRLLTRRLVEAGIVAGQTGDAAKRC